MSLSRTFDVSTASPPLRNGKTRKRPAPFSLRLTPSERARLEAEAGGAPFGAFIKAKLLGTTLPAPVRRRRAVAPIANAKALAQVLALLGGSRLASNLNQLARAANVGALPLTPEVEAELREALAGVAEMRRLLLVALGLKPEGQS